LPAIFTDAYAGDESALLEVFGRRYPPQGQGRRPVIRWRQGLAYGQVKKRYKGSRVARVEVRAVQGKARLAHVLSLLGYKQMNTSVVERHNGTSRLRNQRKVRKTLAFSKVPRYHRWMSWLSVGLYNFCRGHGSLKSVQDTQVQHRSPGRGSASSASCSVSSSTKRLSIEGGRGVRHERQGVQEVAWRAERAAPAHPTPRGLVDGASQRAHRRGGTQ